MKRIRKECVEDSIFDSIGILLLKKNRHLHTRNPITLCKRINLLLLYYNIIYHEIDFIHVEVNVAIKLLCKCGKCGSCLRVIFWREGG